MYYRVSLAQSKIYIRSTAYAAREDFKINTSEAFKQPFHLASLSYRSDGFGASPELQEKP